MKRFQAIVLFQDSTFVCLGSEELRDAMAWIKRAVAVSPDKLLFCAFVLEMARGDIVYLEEPE